MQSEADAYRDELAAEERRLESQLRAPFDGRLCDEIELQASMRRRRARIAELRGLVARTQEVAA